MLSCDRMCQRGVLNRNDQKQSNNLEKEIFIYMSEGKRAAIRECIENRRSDSELNPGKERKSYQRPDKEGGV